MESNPLAQPIMLQWSNGTDLTVELSWPGYDGTVTLQPQARTAVLPAILTDLMILPFRAEYDDQTSEPDLLFVGKAQVADAIYQQASRFSVWEAVDYDPKPVTQWWYHMHLAYSPAEGLVIVGTVELVEVELAH